ncbi:transmembrane protein 92-like [Arvicanthis niloticus]|uniref:transmembrane protein 92-like n=1 Tax=Arvicanthis niloticus TaxID=61156 RepID=UPI0014867309|nr:transmembrane protein 92-like [Arvicanthis niloticus]
MQDTWVLVPLTLIFGLLPSLQGVSTNETVNTCGILSCPKGFRCCGNECCLDRKVWNPENAPFWILFLILLIMLPLLCICGLVKQFCPNCRKLQHDVRTSDHLTPQDPPSIAPLESIWVTSLDPPPPYSQVVLMPTPIEPPPPYSLRPKGPAVQMRGTGYATL